jgi:hypothetical protein
MKRKPIKESQERTPDSAKDMREERIGLRLVGLSRAMIDLTPPLEFLGLLGYRIQPFDVGRTLSDIIQTRVDERAGEIERERDEGEGPRSGR